MRSCFKVRKYAATVMLLLMAWAIPVFTVTASESTGTEGSEPCTCNDLSDIHRKRKEIDDLYHAFLTVLRSFDGPNPPRDLKEVYKRVNEIVYGTAEIAKPVGGVGENDEPVIDPDFAAQHCLAIVQSYVEHERMHIKQKEDLGSYDYPRAVLDDQWWAREMTKAEINAYHTQRTYLDRQLEPLEDECAKRRQWECKCSGRTYDSKAECEGSCSANLGCFVGICRETFKSYSE